MYSRVYLSLIVFCVLSFAFPLLIYIQSKVVNIDIDVNLVLTCVLIIYSSLKLSYLSFKNSQKLMELTFWLFTYVWMAITPYAHQLVGKYAWPGHYSPDNVTFALFIIIIGIFSYEIGIFAAKNKFKNIYQDNENQTELVISAKKICLILLISLAFSFLVLMKIGPSSIFVARLESDQIYSSVFSKTETLIYSNLLKVPIFVVFIISLVIWKNKVCINMDKFLLVLIIICLFITNILISNPISNARYWFGSVIITSLFIIFKWGKNTFAIWVLTLVSLLLIIFPYADAFRSSTTFSFNSSDLIYLLTQKGDYDAFQQLLNTINYVEIAGVSYGLQLLGALFFWVPRNLWVDKPVGSGQLVAETLGYKFTNLSEPLWAEGYINFGILGVVIFFFVYGYISHYLQAKYILSQQKGTFTIFHIIVPFLAAYQIFFLRGDLLNGISYMSCYLLFAIIYVRKNLFVTQKDVNRRRVRITW